MKIAVLASGGVDSSVALRLLHREKHELRAFYLKIWLEDELSYLGECPWEEDLSYVRQICEAASVPLQVVPMQKEYWQRVVQYTVNEAKAGRTPNPDILCNQQIKFGQFYEVIDKSFEKVATGHYAQVEETEKGFILKRAPDLVKDQTYFLAQISQAQLGRALFPIGSYNKKEVRKLAQKFDLPNQARKDSQGICFLGKIPFQEFLKHHLGKHPGDFVNVATGKKVGEHLGYWFYTIGQRNGLGLSGGPWFVVKKDIEKNVIFLAQGYEPEEVYKDEFEVGSIHLINPDFKKVTGSLQVKIRHGVAMHDCQVEGQRVLLKEPVHGVAAGQFAVFYEGDVCLGSAVIL
ncbi:tRNA 2-thiouridine(34) synthase MnmA [Candidatus Peregrinibacteria bacterium]|nr:tRNA 2-thiouridine(34) synthase MnmA [Candidatus Peregrinibacteria bacterium]